MKPLRIYADSSVIGGCGDAEFTIDSQRLVDSARQQQLILLISETTLTELEVAPVDVQNVLKELPLECLEMVPSRQKCSHCGTLTCTREWSGQGALMTQPTSHVLPWPVRTPSSPGISSTSFGSKR